MPIERLPATTSPERVCEALARDGCVELPDDLLRLIGYQRGAYALGYVDDVRDPLEVLRGSRAADSDAGRLGDLERAAAQLRRTR